MADDWIQGAIHHKGAFTKKANAAGKSVEEYAEEQQGAPGILGRQARLALTLKGLRKKKKKKKKPADGAMAGMLQQRFGG